MKNLPIKILLAFIIFFSFSANDSFASTKRGSALARIEILSWAIEVFQKDVGRFPSKNEGLEVLINKPKGLTNWRGPYLNYPFIPSDPWGQKYVYNYPPKYGKKSFDLYSFGPNEIDNQGLKDDLTNWRDHNKLVSNKIIIIAVLLVLFSIVIFRFIYLKKNKKR